jgi:lysozyme family protein
MANFDRALSELLNHEGKWVADPIDHGGETYCGIARRHYPDWSGWPRIDAAKKSRRFPQNLDGDRYLPAMVARFYKKNYWDRFRGDTMKSDELATELLDTSVHVGRRRAVRFLQDGLNLLNRNQLDYPDLVVDGVLGEQTLKSLGAYLKKNKSLEPLLKVLNILQGDYYIAFMRQDPPQERFARGWLART